MEIQGVPYSQEISCATIDHGNSFFANQKVFCFLIHATQDNITGDTCASTMFTLRENIKQKRCGKLSAGVLLFHDNAPTHKSSTSRAAIRRWGFIDLNDPPYSPDLAPSDHFLFRNLKKCLHRQRFPDDNAVKETVTWYIDTQNV